MTTAVAVPNYKYAQTIGNQSTAPAHGFSAPVSVALGKNGLLYVISDYYEYTANGKFVVKCNMDEEYLGHFGTYGSGDGEFTWPNSLAVDGSGNVYLSDEWLHRVNVYDGDGKYLSHWGSFGEGDGELNRPAGMVFDAEDNLYLVDSFNHRVQKLTKDGKFLLKWGSQGKGEGQFDTPWGITIGPDGNVYVADWRNDRIQKFTPDGQFLLQFGTSGQGEGQFHRPSGVGVDKEGYIYVVDWGNDRVQVFDPQGRFATQFFGDCPGYSKWAQERMASDPEGMAEQRRQARSLEPERLFFQPTAIKVDDENRILIVDCGRHRIQIYQKEAA